MTLNRLLFLLLALTLLGCNAYRAKPESNTLFTRDDLTRKGFVLAPIAVPDETLNPGPSELAAYDLILANTLKERWPNAPMLASPEISRTLDFETVERWRASIEDEDSAVASPSTLRILKELTKLGRSYPKQVLLPSLLQNTVSCGQKEALSTHLSPNPHGVKAYCQRLIKMRFRIMDVSSAELLWNGLIYATQETTSDIVHVEQPDAAQKNAELEAPSMQSLIRDCFKNFATQFSDR